MCTSRSKPPSKPPREECNPMDYFARYFIYTITTPTEHHKRHQARPDEKRTPQAQATRQAAAGREAAATLTQGNRWV
eukprot:scaffold31908_cov55-Cyclotella_meneghiniana.AAC.4